VAGSRTRWDLPCRRRRATHRYTGDSGRS
jgi:hypothetical protein